ncbi:MAG: hypothetical protein WD875_03330 [Pirellulales bacterium]
MTDADERGDISLLNYFVGYVVILGAMVGLASLGNQLLGIDPVRMVCLCCGLLFGCAAIGKPRELYLVIRNTGWFHHIRNPVAMRTVLTLFALLLLALGALAPNGALK